jgi:hypothetical protein
MNLIHVLLLLVNAPGSRVSGATHFGSTSAQAAGYATRAACPEPAGLNIVSGEEFQAFVQEFRSKLGLFQVRSKH